MRRFTNFDKMITPTIIKVLFWIGVIVSVLTGLILVVRGASTRFGGGGTVLLGLLIALLGPLFTRLQCELLIIIFKIHETLVEINTKLPAPKEPQDEGISLNQAE
ncbi:MAG: DUF4282 domain-containing protein [Desulfitobacteriaceae bacterium]